MVSRKKQTTANLAIFSFTGVGRFAAPLLLLVLMVSCPRGEPQSDPKGEPQSVEKPVTLESDVGLAKKKVIPSVNTLGDDFYVASDDGSFAYNWPIKYIGLPSGFSVATPLDIGWRDFNVDYNKNAKREKYYTICLARVDMEVEDAWKEIDKFASSIFDYEDGWPYTVYHEKDLPDFYDYLVTCDYTDPTNEYSLAVKYHKHIDSSFVGDDSVKEGVAMNWEGFVLTLRVNI